MIEIYMQSRMGFQLVPQLVTLYDHERCDCHYFASLYKIR